MRKIVATFIVAGTVAACGGSSNQAISADGRGGLQSVTPSRNLHLRAAFDSNPTIYVGRFVPAGVEGGELDENRASKTSCSKFFTAKEIPVNQEMDELVYASSSASASVGALTQGGPAKVGGEHSASNVLRVHYRITKKIQVDSDPDQLSACCSAHPGDCTNLVVGEFLMGSGEIYQANQSENAASGGYGVAPIAVKASYADASKWHKVQSFQDTYFAFLPVATGTVNASAQAKADDEKQRIANHKDASCDFCNHLPDDANGKFFCGVSPPAVLESDGRDAAMTNARAQVVKYLGEQIQSSSATISSTAKGLISDQRFSEAFSKGVAQQVKDRQHCAQQQNSPEHPSVYKVLAYVPNDALVAAATKAVDDVSAGKAKPADVAAAKEAVKKAAK